MNNNHTSYNHRTPGALEISLRARALEKELALMTAEFRAAEKAEGNRQRKNASRGALVQLLTSLRIF